MTLLDYFVIAIIFVLIAFGGFERYQIDQLKIASIVAIHNQQDADNADCNKDKKETQDENTKLKADLASTNVQYLGLLNTTPTTVYITKPARPSNGTAAKPQCATTNTISTKPLIDIANGCQQDAIKLKGLQDFVTEVWKEKAGVK